MTPRATAMGAAPTAGQRGFSLVGVLLIVAVLGLVAAAGLKLGAVAHRRHAERALLEVGAAFSRALGSYARATPAGQPDAPRSLEDLLLDTRQPGRLRHLRKAFADPMTGRTDWGFERDEDGRILAIYSQAEGRTIQRTGFEARFADFAGKERYPDWKFARAPEEAPASGRAPRPGLISRPGRAGDDSAADADGGSRKVFVPTSPEPAAD